MRVAAGAVLLLGMLSLSAQPAGTTAPPTAPTFVLRARAVYPVTPEQPGPIERGMVLVENGRIVAVGRDLDVPPDVPLLDLPNAVICPGFVSAGSALTGSHAGPDTVSAAYHAADAFDRYADYADVLARGTTTAHVSPGEHRLVSGEGAVVKLAGPPQERLLVPAADLTVNLGVFDPPPLVKPPFWASSDVPIEPARGQRPDSRLGQYLELEERIAGAEAAPAVQKVAETNAAPRFDLHARSFVDAWQAHVPLRIQVRRAADLEGALAFVKRHARPAYLVGLTEADQLVDALRGADLPLVLRVEESFRAPGPNLGPNPEALEPHLRTAQTLAESQPTAAPAPIALAGQAGDRREDLRMAAILAVRGGLDAARSLAGITRIPAEILGVAARVGSLAPGKDADLLVLTGAPLDINSFVRQAYVDGRLVFDADRLAASVHPTSQPATVIRAGTIWVGDGSIVRDGSVLIENGKIQAVGQRVPHPPLAQIIDAGATAFVAPGFIDAHGHLGLEGDTTIATPDLPLHRAVATAGREFLRVARAGVTTVLLAPYRGTPNGARMAAIKTFGSERSELVARELIGVHFSLRGLDPLTGVEPVRRALQAGKKYDEDWKKYEAELAKWNDSRGKEAPKPKEETEAVAERGKPDPITGKWEYTITGEPLPQSVSGTVVMKLTGSMIEGRLSDPMSGEEVSVSGSLNGNEIVLEVNLDTPFGRPTIRATLDREDHVTGTASVGQITLTFEATRTDKSAVEFRVQYRTKRTKDGRPTPPKLDENLEPLRPLLAGKVPAVVDVASAGEINAALKLFADEFKVSLVLLGAEDATDIAAALLAHKEKLGGVIVPREIERTRLRAPYVEAADLSQRGIRVALQSDSEDGARDLPEMGLFAVRQGLGGDAALKALTIDAAKMYKLEDRVGSLEVGKDADVLIFSGYPFDAGSRLEHVIVGGREVPNE